MPKLRDCDWLTVGKTLDITNRRGQSVNDEQLIFFHRPADCIVHANNDGASFVLIAYIHHIAALLAELGYLTNRSSVFGRIYYIHTKRCSHYFRKKIKIYLLYILLEIIITQQHEDCFGDVIA